MKNKQEEKLKFYKFVENNDWEGKTWNFFIKTTLSMRNKLSELIKNANLEETYRISEDSYSRMKVKTLLFSCEDEDDEQCSYMPSFQYVGVLDKPLPESIDLQGTGDPFYKGGISEFCTVDEEIV